MTAPTEQTLQSMRARYALTPISADLSSLSDRDRKTLRLCIAAAQVINDIYFEQVWDGNAAMLDSLRRNSHADALSQAQHQYFVRNKGPWCQLDKVPFIDGVPDHQPKGANVYPGDMSVKEFETWVKTLTEKQAESAKGFYTVIRRTKDGGLRTVRYSTEYKEKLAIAAELLDQASCVTRNKSLRRFLQLRAKAFLTNNYYASDVAWMALDSALEIVIGPYETYEDELFSAKAMFEAYVCVVNHEMTARLQQVTVHLQDIEDNLPIDPKHRNPKIGASSPLRVVDQIFAAGEGDRGIMTAAFNLPNSEKITKRKGTKQVLLRNVQQAKFTKVLMPIAQLLLRPELLPYVDFDSFFTHVMVHELMHGLGPHVIKLPSQSKSPVKKKRKAKADSKKTTTVRACLKHLYTTFEEAKADISGLFGIELLMDKGVFDPANRLSIYASYLASTFRSIRFGLGQAHGRGQALQFNYLLEAGAVTINEETGEVGLNMDRVRSAVESLTGVIMTIQAEGDFAKAEAMFNKYVVITPAMQKALDRVKDVPVDIEPQYSNQ